MSDHSAIRDAGDSVDEAMANLEGFVIALEHIMFDTECIDHSVNDAKAMMCLIRAISEGTRGAATLREAEWRLICDAFDIKREVQP